MGYHCKQIHAFHSPNARCLDSRWFTWTAIWGNHGYLSRAMGREIFEKPLFAIYLAWFPIGLASPIGITEDEVTIGQRIWHMVLPALCLSMVSMPTIALHTRMKLVEALDSDYATYARARGESEYKIVTQQCLRNIILPALMLQFASFSELFGGSVLVEQVFSYPGLGRATVSAGLGGDVPLLLGITIFSAIFVFSGNAIGDLLMHMVDPRMRVQERKIG